MTCGELSIVMALAIFAFSMADAFNLFNGFWKGNQPVPPQQLTSLVEKKAFVSFENKDALLLVETARLGKRPSWRLRIKNAISHFIWDEGYFQLLNFLESEKEELLDMKMEIAEIDVTNSSSDLFKKIDGTRSELFGKKIGSLLMFGGDSTISIMKPSFYYRDRWGISGSMTSPSDASSVVDFVCKKLKMSQVARIIASGEVVDNLWSRDIFLAMKRRCKKALTPIGALHLQLPEDFPDQHLLFDMLKNLAARRNGVAIYVERIPEKGKPNVYELKRYKEYKENTYDLPLKIEEAITVLKQGYDRIVGKEFKHIAEQAKLNATQGRLIHCTGFFGGQFNYILAYEKDVFVKSIHVGVIEAHRKEAESLLDNLARKKEVNIMTEFINIEDVVGRKGSEIMLSSEGLIRTIPPEHNFTEKVLKAYEDERDGLHTSVQLLRLG